MNWKKVHFYCLWHLSFVIMAVGCNAGQMTERLALIDTLLVHDEVDSALHQLSNIPLDAIQSKSDSAYYFLLLTEATYRTPGAAMSDSSIIIFCTEYYKNSSDKEKLARSYYYRGVIRSKELHNIKETILLLKQAEEKAKGTNNLLLKHKIYESLSYYNSEFFERGLALFYANRALQVAEELNDNERKAIAFLYMAGSYSHLGKADSLSICVQQCLSLADYITDTDKAYLYTRIGELYADTEPEMAKKYLLKAVDIYPQLWTYRALSGIYAKENHLEEARKIWAKALQMNESIEAKIDILKTMRQQEMEQKDYLEANELADSIMVLETKLYDTQKREQMAEIQAKYDKEAAERELKSLVRTWGMGLLAVIAIVIGFLGRKSYEGMKSSKELAESKLQLGAYMQKARELESSGKASAQEINELHRKIDELHHRHSGILAKGKELAEALEAGGTTVLWGKSDFQNFLEYYKMKDLPFVNEMETDYSGLSAKYIFFAVLEHEGKTDADIQRIMGISENTLRSTRSRINRKRL